MPFSYDWFSGNISNWSRILEPMKGLNDMLFLEIGCFEGRATVWLLENILTGKNSRIICVDTFEGSEEHKVLAPVDFKNTEQVFRENIDPWFKQDRVFISKMSSQDFLHFVARPIAAMAYHSVHDCKFDHGAFNFIYIDGSHHAADVLADAVLSWRLLKRGGIMIFDDYMWDAYKEPEKNPRLAIDSFLSVYLGQYKILLKEYQVAIQKI